MDQLEFNEWLRLREELKQIKAREAELRKEVGKLVMGTELTGTNHAELFSHELKAKIPLVYTVDPDISSEVYLTDQMMACIKWKPSLVLKEYNKLSDSEKEKLSPYIISKPGSLSIEVEEVQL